MNFMLTIQAENIDETQKLANQLAAILPKSFFISLNGQLGAGKTTFCRCLLRALGYQEKVKSPTFTMIETYDLMELIVYHFDLYRIQEIEELELIGIRDYFATEAIILIEWAERGAGILPDADISCNIQIRGTGRIFQLISQTPKGASIIKQLI